MFIRGHLVVIRKERVEQTGSESRRFVRCYIDSQDAIEIEKFRVKTSNPIVIINGNQLGSVMQSAVLLISVRVVAINRIISRVSAVKQ